MFELNLSSVKQVTGAGVCEGSFRLAGAIIGAGIGGYVSGGFGAAAGFSFGQQVGVWAGDMFCS
ncbi:MULTISPECIES: hypothetical protein [Pseudoalteromonas]|uniref:Uncharacterized protein n=1 Tax=Pseudoalteromonas piscicida TaxID=43662 RepID=A0AAD0RKX0_PSEO7|nr:MULTISPECIES: hypothetical protein [Pseudoalteromonas]ASD68807.1 hypothetical protein B1L02_18425 [Pseudoalteromonas piscicida]AXR03864.1 hypothetical protein D0511_18505 [Pseudoalteromonas piscicida]